MSILNKKNPANLAAIVVTVASTFILSASSSYATGPTGFVNCIPQNPGIGTRSKVDIHACDENGDTKCVKGESWGGGNLWRDVCELAGSRDISLRPDTPVKVASGYRADGSYVGATMKLSDCCDGPHSPPGPAYKYNKAKCDKAIAAYKSDAKSDGMYEEAPTEFDGQLDLISE